MLETDSHSVAKALTYSVTLGFSLLVLALSGVISVVWFFVGFTVEMASTGLILWVKKVTK